MIKINSLKFGQVVIADKKYSQVIIFDGKVEERDSQKLNSLFATAHIMGDWEKEQLLKDQPEVVVIGSGFQSLFETPDDFVKSCKERGIELFLLPTPEAVNKYNDLMKTEKKVNALIHTTC